MNDDVRRCAEALWQAATAGDEYAAIEVAVSALDSGLPAESLILDVVAAVQARIGLEWAHNRLSVAQEHTATAVNESVLVVSAHHAAAGLRGPEQAKGRICLACVEGEWHTFPLRLLAEVLRLRGWRVDYLGANVPTSALVVHLHRTGPSAVALSASIATHLPAAHAAITACRAASTPVLAGGPAFGPDGRYARRFGADAWAPDARAAADLLDHGLPRRDGPGRGHQADLEYAVLDLRTPDLVRAVMDELDRHAGETGPHGDTAEDAASIVGFLKAAVYVGDPGLFASFAGWMAELLGARGMPAPALPAALDALADGLPDLPHARAMLRV
ncbi:B12 binding domain protein [Nonomuraea coxensis DSM 45129]|uniref:B12 binding domain protein n=1 Tax=Nonomuraea coxensis DSM 45129 TaxID=1122611 RepID=A0ABX8U2X3_9ACTN|nr:cobalamin-dependent protein [Nonomuraea coxensis]QYC40993.1 B12 binding domain protein [Nonomuraea coxensis DSM 45129]